eukprot:5996470-Prymnesium_polylepis.1
MCFQTEPHVHAQAHSLRSPAVAGVEATGRRILGYWSRRHPARSPRRQLVRSSHPRRGPRHPSGEQLFGAQRPASGPRGRVCSLPSGGSYGAQRMARSAARQKCRAAVALCAPCPPLPLLSARCVPMRCPALLLSPVRPTACRARSARDRQPWDVNHGINVRMWYALRA